MSFSFIIRSLELFRSCLRVSHETREIPLVIMNNPCNTILSIHLDYSFCIFYSSESKEQKDNKKHPIIVYKRKRGRPRFKQSNLFHRISSKKLSRTIKSKKKVKIKDVNKRKSCCKKKLKQSKNTTKLSLETSRICEEREDLNLTVLSENNQITENSETIALDKNYLKKDINEDKKLIKERNKPSIFEVAKMDFTILNDIEVKEKPKRIRKRDKKSRELAALSKPESFECVECGRKFKEKSHLATHSRAHINVRNFKCNRCGKLFKTKTSLFFHMKTHSDTPFTCEKCNKTYQERRMLMRHIRIVHR